MCKGKIYMQSINFNQQKRVTLLILFFICSPLLAADGEHIKNYTDIAKSYERHMVYYLATTETPTRQLIKALYNSENLQYTASQTIVIDGYTEVTTLPKPEAVFRHLEQAFMEQEGFYLKIAQP